MLSGEQNHTPKKITSSVAICTCDGESFITEQLESIASQSVPVDEIVICDDNSSDNTLSVVNDFRLKHRSLSITVIHNRERLGVIRNFEQALRKCSGDIIFLSDQDDVWLQDKVQVTIREFVSSPNVEMVFSDALLIDGNGQLITGPHLFDRFAFTKKIRNMWKAGLEMDILNVRNVVTGATVALRKSFLQTVLPFSESLGLFHDEQLAISSAKRGSLKMLEEALIQYRVHEKNVVGVWLNRDMKEARRKWYFPSGIRKELSMIAPELSWNNESFANERHELFLSARGRLALLLSLPKYMKHYRHFFLSYYVADLTCGLSNWARRRFERIFIPGDK